MPLESTISCYSFYHPTFTNINMATTQMCEVGIKLAQCSATLCEVWGSRNLL